MIHHEIFEYFIMNIFLKNIDWVLERQNNISSHIFPVSGQRKNVWSLFSHGTQHHSGGIKLSTIPSDDDP